MRAATLLIVFAIGKTAALWGRPIDWSWTVIAYFWQDVLVALMFAVVDRASRRAHVTRHLLTAVYFTIAGWAALNIPVLMVLSTPLTWPMLRATSGTLADSILLYATPAVIVAIAITMAAIALLPRVIAHLPEPAWRAVIAGALLVVSAGPMARARVDALGLDRNAVLALLNGALPHVQMQAAAGDWTTPPFESANGIDLSHLRGIARGGNIVLVSLESTAAQYLRLYGSHEDVTPRLEALARHGVVFENAYAAYPESIKGLYSILCSTFPAFDTAAEKYERAPCRSIAALLTKAGYRTALFHSGRFAYLGMEAVIRDRGYEVLEDAGDIGGNHESSFGVDEASTVARMLAWVDTLPAGQPFFLTYLPIAGHHPYETPATGPFPGNDESGRYRNALRHGDAALGVLIDGLNARGRDRATTWIVIGDHGEAFGQHEGNYGHTFFLYDENVRVPFVVATPAVPTPQRSRAIVSLVDTAPTILDLAGVAIPDDYQGQSALTGRARMALFFTDYSLGMFGLRDGGWKFIHELDSRRSKLFDLSRDPGERIDVSAHQPARVRLYKDALRGWSAAQKAYVTMSDHR